MVSVYERWLDGMAEGKTQRTLVIVKPDAVQRGLIGPILDRFERRGLKIAALRLMQIDQDVAAQHYSIHKGKSFFAGLVSYITSGPVVVIVLEGPNAIAVVRKTMGATNAAEADLGTIRGDFALEIGRNLVHGSDSETSAATEIALFFKPEEIISYDPWIME
jgi:nucleoside-diphosphate kinase